MRSLPTTTRRVWTRSRSLSLVIPNERSGRFGFGVCALDLAITVSLVEGVCWVERVDRRSWRA